MVNCSKLSNVQQRSMIIVAGMHRSGTSAITRVLNLCGASLSNTLMKPAKSENDLGFWECQQVMELHDELLESFGCAWDSLTSIPTQWFLSSEAVSYKYRLIKIIDEEYGDFHIGVVKDPRICKLIPLWKMALNDMGVKAHFLISVRNPLEVVKSLKKRNGFKQKYSLGLWFIHLKILEQYTREDNRIFVRYTDLLNDYSAVIERVNLHFHLDLDSQSIDVQRQIQAFLSDTLRHHRFNKYDLKSSSGVPQIIKIFYLWLLKESRIVIDSGEGENMEYALNAIDNSNFNRFLENIQSLERQLDNRISLINELESALQKYVEQRQESINKSAQSYGLLDDLETPCDDQLIRLSLIIDQKHEQVRLNKELDQLNESLSCKDNRIEKLKNQIDKELRENEEIEKRLQNAVDDWGSAIHLLNQEIEHLKEVETDFEQLSDTHIELIQRYQELETRMSAIPDMFVWRLGTKLSILIREFRTSKVGKLVLFVKAVISCNLSNYLDFQKKIRIVSNSGLFDKDFYLRTYPLIEYSIKTPVEHYVGHGEREGRQPNSFFSPGFYSQQLSDRANDWSSQLVHYIQEGAISDLDPSPKFSTKFYRKSNSIGSENPLAHFLRFSQQDKRVAEDTGQQINDSVIKFVDSDYYESINPLQDEIDGLIKEIKVLSLKERISELNFPDIQNPEVSIVIPFFNKLEFTVDCLYALRKQEYKNYEVILVDDASDKDDCSDLASVDGITLIQNITNLGYLRSCNLAVSKAVGKFIVQLNNDTLPLKGWLENLVETFQHYPDAGLAGSMFLDVNCRIQEAGGIIFNDASGYNYGRGDKAVESRYNYCREVDYCSGASIIIKRSLWDRLGGYDKRFAPAYYEDTDLAMRVREEGYKVIYNPFSKIVHHEGVSSGTSVKTGIKRYQEINKNKFYDKWKKQLDLKSPKASPDTINEYVKGEVKKGWILWVDSATPTPDKDSGSIDTVHFFEKALTDGWGISFVPWGAFRHEGRYTDNLQKIGVECIYYPSATAEACLNSLSDLYDIVVVSRATVARYAYPLVKKLFPTAKVIFNTVDLHFLRYDRETELLRQFPKYQFTARSQRVDKDEEIGFVKGCDATIVVSEAEKEVLTESAPNANIKVISLFREVVGRKNMFKDRANIGFIGGFQHPPNVDAIKYFVSDIWPMVSKKLKNTKFIIAGSNVPEEIKKLSSRTVEVRGYVPTLQELLEEVRVMVAPLRYGAGKKGKIVSGLCYGVPQVVTMEAAEGMGLEHSLDAMITSQAREFADHIISLYTDPELWEKLSKNAVTKAHDEYSKEAISAEISKLLDELIQASSEST